MELLRHCLESRALLAVDVEGQDLEGRRRSLRLLAVDVGGGRPRGARQLLQRTLALLLAIDGTLLAALTARVLISAGGCASRRRSATAAAMPCELPRQANLRLEPCRFCHVYMHSHRA